LWQHLLQCVGERKIPLADLQRLQALVKDFGSYKLWGSGEYPKTFLLKGMKAYGQEID
jgi:hypothetical protein